jgi:oxaloacetate decarboxylase gamma subunit
MNMQDSGAITRFVNSYQLNNQSFNDMNLILLQATVAELSNWDKFTEALLLMAIGMLTVFTVLLIIIALGTLLIKTVNKFFPEEVKPVAKAAAAVQAVDQNIQEAINKAIMAISGGKKQAQKIEKI